LPTEWEPAALAPELVLALALESAPALASELVLARVSVWALAAQGQARALLRPRLSPTKMR
jgi:hypothetical protein